jgi:hypothetical protein
VVTDDLTELLCIITMPAQRPHQHRETGLVLDDQLHHHLGEVGPMISTLTVGTGHDLFVRRLIALLTALDMEAEASEMRAGRGKAQALRSGRGNEAGEFRHPNVVEGIAGAPEGVSIEMVDLHAWGHEACERLMLEEMRDEGELVVEKAKTVKHHGLDRRPGGHHPHGRVLLGGGINDLGKAEFFNHGRDQTQVV